MAFKDKDRDKEYHREWEKKSKRHLRPERKALSYKARKRYAKTEKGKATLKRAADNYRARHKADIIKRRSHLKQRYGLTVEAWDIMLIKQSGRCDCCFLPMEGKGPCVDHNHKTGEVRALVCHDCNIAVAWLEDKVHKLALAERYLSRYDKPDYNAPDCCSDVFRSKLSIENSPSLPKQVAWLGVSH